MKTSAVRRAVVAAAAAGTLLLAGCADDGADVDTTDEELMDETPTDAPGASGQTGPVDVPDVTRLILETAEGNLLRAGLEAEVVDTDGEPVVVEDPTGYRVVDQDPAEGTLDPGSPVILTVEVRE